MRGKFDLAILLPNSFKSALVCKMAGIERIVGYERDGRGFLLTDKLLPVKERGKFVPTPIVKYYLGIAQYLGSDHRDIWLELFVTESERREAEEVLARVRAWIRAIAPRRRGAARRRWSSSTPVRSTARPSAGCRSTLRSWPIGSSRSRRDGADQRRPRRSARSSTRSTAT